MARHAVATITLVAAITVGPAAPAAAAQVVRWQANGQADPSGAALDAAASRGVVVVPGDVIDTAGNSQWYVRGVDERTGATRWEDRFGPLTFGLGKDVAADRERAYVAGWLLTPGLGFEFVVRAYDLDDGTVRWTQSRHLGAGCGQEAPRFGRCVAKAVAVDDGRVYAVGHLTATAGRSDFAVVAFDAATGATLWESVTDPLGTGAFDYAWAVGVGGDTVFVLGETGDMTGLLLQAHDARTGGIRWQRHLPGATNFTLKTTLAVGDRRAFIAGVDAAFHPLVQAYDARTGSLAWEHRVVDGDRIGDVAALALDEAGLLYATGVTGCDPLTFVDCRLAVRAYDPDRGLLWERADPAAGGDWASSQVAAAGGLVFAGALERGLDGAYHPVVRAYHSPGGGFVWSDAFDDDGGTNGGFATGFVTDLLARRGTLVVTGNVFRPDGGADFRVRSYRTHGRPGDDNEGAGDR
jgi:outer membrane protein assembly factor BamB